MTLGLTNSLPDFSYKDVIIKNTTQERVLGITIDNKLNFKAHLKNICKVANQKLHALCRISNYILSDQCKLLVNAFLKSQFSYCPQMWMFCSRGSNTKINRIHEKALRITLNDYTSSFTDLLLLSNEITTIKDAQTL